MSFNTATPYIASYLLLEKDGHCAFVKRANTGWRDNYYGLPAGKVEQQESFSAAAVREAFEEVGVLVQPVDLVHVLTSHRFEDDKAWVDVIFKATIWTGEIYNKEPLMHSEVAWFSLDDLPVNTIPSLRYMLNEIGAGRNYCEYGWDGLTSEVITEPVVERITTSSGHPDDHVAGS